MLKKKKKKKITNTETNAYVIFPEIRKKVIEIKMEFLCLLYKLNFIFIMINSF